MEKNILICQSCGMPLTKDEDFGTEKNGSKSLDYCACCYQDGGFIGEESTMEQMIDFCAPIMVREGSAKTAEEARQMMHRFFPQLKRWKNN